MGTGIFLVWRRTTICGAPHGTAVAAHAPGLAAAVGVATPSGRLPAADVAAAICRISAAHCAAFQADLAPAEPTLPAGGSAFRLADSAATDALPSCSRDVEH